MAGTKAGGLAAATTNKQRHGKEFYSKIGAMGGRKGKTGGFYYSMINGLDTHIKAGKKGGEISKRTKK